MPNSSVDAGTLPDVQWSTWPKVWLWPSWKTWCVSRQDFPTGYVCVAADLPDGLAILSEQELRDRYALHALNSKALGDWWIDSHSSAVLVVRSTVIAAESNYLLNPAHRDFSKITIEPPALFHFDPRLFG